MSSQLTIFQFGQQSIRTGEVDGQPVFCLADLLAAIGSSTKLADAQFSITDVFGEGQVINLPTTDALQREREAVFVYESGATFLISRSRTEAGKKLNRWLHSEVLPSIRKTGGYNIDRPQPQRQLAPQRDLYDYYEMAKGLGIDQDPILKSLFSQRMAEQLGGNILPAAQQVIATVRAHELGFSAKEVGNGSGLGKFIKKQGCEPTGKTQHGKYLVNVYDLTADLDRAIRAYFS